MAKISLCLGLTAFGLCMLIASTHAQKDFLNIDCGAGTDYTDSGGFDWVTDDAYVQTGTKLQVEDYQVYYFTLRYFSRERSKNCFVLPVKKQTTYLLRTSYYLGNATTVLALPIDFNVTVNNDLLNTHTEEDENDIRITYDEAIVHTFDKNETYVCLLRGTQGNPFLNAIELRPLPATAYGTELKENMRFLSFAGRFNTGTREDADPSLPVRFPDDPYDRLWKPTTNATPRWLPSRPYQRVERVGGPLPPDSDFFAPDGYNWPPRKVLDDAWVGRDLSLGPLHVPPGVVATKFYVAFYIQEIRANVTAADMVANPLGMILGVNDFLSAINFTTLGDQQRDFGIFTDGATTLNFTVKSQPWSKQSAILNAIEVLYSDPLDTSAISLKDSSAVKILQNSFGLLDWTGDPCYPVAWDWLTCDPETSRVVKLELSDMNISGSIPEEISTLTALTEIHLDKNNLTGKIPQSMSFLTKLKVLALDDNNLSGNIPVPFLNRAGFTFGGNPELCPLGNLCSSAPPAPPAPQVPSAAVKAALLDIRIKFLICLTFTVVVAMLA